MIISNIRFISLRRTKVSIVPRQVENLKHLQTLDLAYTLLVGLPETVTKLEKLEHLDFSSLDNYWDTVWTMPRGLSRMKRLRRLGMVCLGNDSVIAKEIGELEQLQKLELLICCGKTITDDDVLKELALYPLVR